MCKNCFSLNELEEKIKNDAEGYFRVGLNCAECVFKSYLDLGICDFNPEVIAFASGFGGGIGMTQNTCGALLGAALSVSTVKGRKNPLEKETFEERVDELNCEDGIYDTFAKLVNDFEKNYGTILCKELTTPFNDFHSRERKKKCKEIIGYASTLAIKYVVDSQKSSNLECQV